MHRSEARGLLGEGFRSGLRVWAVKGAPFRGVSRPADTKNFGDTLSTNFGVVDEVRERRGLPMRRQRPGVNTGVSIICYR